MKSSISIVRLVQIMPKNGSTIILFNNHTKEKVFLVFRSDFPIWGTTGGGIEKGESPRNAALREAFEETGFRVKIIRKVGVYEKRRPQGIEKIYLYEGRVVSGTFKPEFLGCKGKWFDVNKLPISMINREKEKIFDCIKYDKKMFTKQVKPFSLRGNLHLLFLHPVSMIRFIRKRYRI